MKTLDLSEVRHSLYFWPAVTLSGIAVFFFGWAALIFGTELGWNRQSGEQSRRCSPSSC
jgi:hypothetical protein